MQKVSIPSDATSAEIVASVEREFNEHHITHVVDHGFRLLRVRPILKKSGVVKKGKAPLLRPLKGVSEVNLVNWERCLANTNVRNAGKGFKNLIFIALNPAGPNLPFGGVTEFSDDSLDEDLESAHGSDSDAGDPEAAATGSKAKRGRVSDSGSDSNNDSDNHTAKKSKDIHMASDEDRKKAKAEKPEKSNAEKQRKAKAKAVPVDDSDSDDSSDTGDKGKGKAILTDNDGSDGARKLTIVGCPLKALEADQVKQATAKGINAILINEDNNGPAVWKSAQYHAQVMYVSPEMALSDQFTKLWVTCESGMGTDVLAQMNGD
ncbi:hypothetical protein B0H10DRAFT_2228922 [Mycena sp. CBHHK59/15]|nr:hypothetical protein B0H10DRAFT_2228922 [Mycena sp. CBHHK59/15]